MSRHLRPAAWLAAALLAPALILAADKKPAPAPVTPAAPAPAEWVSLFDGKSIEGWEILELPGQKTPTKWEVVDGLLLGSGGQSMIFSPKGNYKNFRFRAEVKINDHGNSGMYFRTPKGNTFMNGYEAQINATHADPIKSGSLYTFVHLYSDSNPPPPDTFFTQEVDVQDVNFRGKVVTRVRMKINDKVLYEFHDFGRSWKEGFFAFQQHDPGSKVAIRKVEVMELPETK